MPKEHIRLTVQSIVHFSSYVLHSSACAQFRGGTRTVALLLRSV